MNRTAEFRPILTAMLFILGAGLSLGPLRAIAQVEETFEVLKIGTHTYTKVRVTTKAKNYIMLMHSEGLANIKVSEISPELRQQLGYEPTSEDKAKNKANDAAKWAKEKVASLNVREVQAMEANFKQAWEEKVAAGELPYVGKITPGMIYCAAGGALIGWLMLCGCLRTICRKTGNEPGLLIWLPVLQIFPMLKAAEMSMAWILGCPIGLTQLVWCFKIAKARGKGAFTGLCLLFPGTHLLALLYLTFSDGEEMLASKAPRGSQVLTLKTA